MDVYFWGVRGSVPTPLSPEQVRNKISAIVQRIQTKDINNQESRELFLDSLPKSLMGTIGGNTTCIEVRLKDDTIILFDAGTGIIKFGQEIKKKGKHKRKYNIFFSHFHWDHIQGLPFFAPQMYDKECSVAMYSPKNDLRDVIAGQMKQPYFPISLDVMSADLSFNHLFEEPFSLGNSLIWWKKVNHPGDSFSYKIVEDGKSIIFSTDTELGEKDFVKNEENCAFYENTDLLIIDSQYTLDEAIEKYNWGHSSYSMAIDFALEWGIRKIVLFHHEPLYDDSKLFSIRNSSQWYMEHLELRYIDIYLAHEGLKISV